MKYAHYRDECPLKQKPDCSSRLGERSERELTDRKLNFRNDAISHSCKQLVVQKRAKKTDVTGRHNDPGFKVRQLMSANGAGPTNSGYYSKNLRST